MLFEEPFAVVIRYFFTIRALQISHELPHTCLWILNVREDQKILVAMGIDNLPFPISSSPLPPKVIPNDRPCDQSVKYFLAESLYSAEKALEINFTRVPPWKVYLPLKHQTNFCQNPTLVFSSFPWHVSIIAYRAKCDNIGKWTVTDWIVTISPYTLRNKNLVVHFTIAFFLIVASHEITIYTISSIFFSNQSIKKLFRCSLRFFQNMKESYTTIEI